MGFHNSYQKSKFVISLVTSILLFPLVGQAKVYKIEDVPIVHLEDATKYVCNPDSILTPSTVAAIDSMFYALEQSTGIETVVLALTDIEGGDCFQFALDLGNKYGVGKKETDNGLVVLLSTEQRCIQFVTGYGLEGTLPDATCKQIQTKYMNSYFAKGEWDKGMLEGMKVVYGCLDGSMEVTQEMGLLAELGYNSEWPVLYKIGFWIFMFFGGLFLLILGAALLFAFVLPFAILWDWLVPKRCPECKKRGLKRVSKTLVFRKGGKQRYHLVFKCSKCGHVEEKDEDSSYGSSGSSSHGSSSSSRGSFGGGSFGGGGAGSRF